MLPFILLMLALALEVKPQVVNAAGGQFKFKLSTVRQCEPVSIEFIRSNNAKALPTSLTLLPFNSTPVSIPLPTDATNSTGVTVSFLPIPANTSFLASIDDAEGDNSARVSDVFRVQPSSGGDNSCVSLTPPPRQFTFPTILSQCKTFDIGFTSAEPPVVRVFSPLGGSFNLTRTNTTMDIAGNGVATYMMAVNRLRSVVLMASSGEIENGQTSPLMLVEGDASSSSDCLNRGNGRINGQPNQSGNEAVSSGVPRGVIIGITVGAVFIVLIALAIAGFYMRRRRAQRGKGNCISFNPALLEKPYVKSEPTSPEVAILPYAYVANPLYTRSHYSQPSSDMDERLVTTWRPDNALPGNLARTASQVPSMGPAKTASSINAYDIEQMLNFAAPDNSMPRSSSSIPSLQEPQPVARTLLGPRSHLDGSRPDVPVSMVLSPSGERASANIFDSPTSMSVHDERDSFASSNFEILTRPALSPKEDRLQPPANTPSSRFSDPSLLDGGSIADFRFPKPPYARGTSPRDSTESWGNLNTPRLN